MQYNNNINYKLLIYSILIFSSALVISLFLSKFKESEEKIIIENEMNLLSLNAVTEINNKLNSLMNSTYTLSSLLKNNNYETKKFDIWANDIYKNFPYLSSIQLAKNGVVSHVFPYEIHKKALGHNLLKDKKRDAGAKEAISNNSLTFIGPIKLIQNNKYAIIARLPLFKDEKFWGFATAIIELDSIFENIKTTFENSNYEFAIKGLNPDSKIPATYSSILSYDSKIIKKVEISVPNGIWELSVQPKNIEKHMYLGIYAITLFFTLLFIILIIIYEKRVNNSVLRELEINDLLNLYLSRSPLSIIVLDTDAKILEWNKAAEDTFGYTKEEILGKSIIETLVPKDIRPDLDVVLKALRNGSMETNNINTNITKDGKTLTCEWFNTPLRNSSGQIDKIMAVGIDISQKVKNQELIQTQKQELETIFNTTIDGIATINKEFKFTHFNDAYLKMTRFKKEELLNKSYFDLMYKEDIQETKKMFEDLKKQKFIKNFEKNYILSNNEEISVNSSLSLLPDEESILISTKDITQLKHLESKSKLADMGEMIANIAHQWRQPLGVISTGATGMMLQKEFDKLSDEMFYTTCSQIDKNAQYLSRTIDDFRNFIKGEHILIEFNLKENMNSFLNLVDGVIKSKHIKVDLNVDENTKLYGYPNELNQCLINIFNNAKDALEKIEEDNRYVFIEQEEKNKTIKIKIKDSAGGIKKEIISKIFEPYFTTKHKSKGTGLGLSMTYKLITEAMGGDIKVRNVDFAHENKNLKGAEFIITLPIQKSSK